MKKQEIMTRIADRIEQDEDFATQLGAALERGTWEIIADLIAKVTGFIINKTSENFDALKESLR